MQKKPTTYFFLNRGPLCTALIMSAKAFTLHIAECIFWYKDKSTAKLQMLLLNAEHITVVLLT